MRKNRKPTPFAKQKGTIAQKVAGFQFKSEWFHYKKKERKTSMLEYYEIMKRVLDVKTNKTICVIETFPLITENVPSDKSIFINWENAEEQIQEENLPMRIQGKKGKRILQIFAPKIVEIEEKKNPIFALCFEEKAIPAEPSLQKILNYPQGEIALKWILERK